MLQRLITQFLRNAGFLCLVPLAVMPSQHNAKTGKGGEVLEVQMKVTDTKTGNGIDNAEVVIKWGDGPGAHSATATTNANGVARFSDAPRGNVQMRVMAKGYKVYAPKPMDLTKEDQPIKIELEKQTFANDHARDTTSR
jgi:hypothetical protein